MYILIAIYEHGLVQQPFKTLSRADDAFKIVEMTKAPRYIALYTGGHLIRENRFPEFGRRYQDGTDGS